MKEFKLNDENKIPSGFTIPEGYFDQFTVELNSKINLPKAGVKVISMNTKRWITSIAAILIVALSVSIYSKIAVSNSDKNNTTENYLTNQSDISQYDLITLLDKKDIENLSIELNSDNSKIDEEFANSNEIENYLTE